MSDFPKQISAPALNPTYGANVKQTFENIDSNFNVLANRELYKGDAGTNLVTVNAPWSAVFSNNPTITVGGYTITNFGSDIRAALGAIQGATASDVNSVVNSLAASNWTITVSFIETEGTATVISCVPYVFVDPRFRSEGIISSNLQNCTDLSCVITRNGSSTVNGGWVCTQNFPTLYYDYNSETSEGNLYWIINGQKTKILAQGPKGKDGSTGVVYVGLTDDLKLYPTSDTSHSHNGGVNGGTLAGAAGTSENIDITYLLCTSQLTDDQKSGLSDTSKYPFIPIADWVAIYGSPMTAPIMVLPEDPISITIDTEVVSPYYISTAYVGTGETTTVSSTVSKYNICYCHMTDVMIKNAIRNNVLRLPNGFPTTPVEDGVIPGYSIKESIGDGGYCIFVPNSGVLTIAYVTDVDEPSESNWDNNNSKLKIVANIAAGYETGLGHIYSNGRGSLAHGFAMDASTIETNSNGSHAEGYVANEAGANGGSHIKSDASALGGYARGVAVNGGLIKAGGGGAYAGGYADGDGIGTASGDDNDSLIKSTGQGAHAEGYTATLGHIKASADGSFANGYAGAEGKIKATAPGAHAEGAVDGADAVISADGRGAHAEGYADVRGIIVASQPGAHAEGYAKDYRISAQASGAHAEGYAISGNIIASGVGSHIEGGASEGNSTASGAYSHVEGDTNSASGRHAHAEGMHTSATGSSSHAEGYGTNADGAYSHAEGLNTQAYTDHSHAEGESTKAKGWPSLRGGMYSSGNYVNDGTGYRSFKLIHIYFTPSVLSNKTSSQLETLKSLFDGVTINFPGNGNYTCHSSEMSFLINAPSGSTNETRFLQDAYRSGVQGLIIKLYKSASASTYNYGMASGTLTLSDSWWISNWSSLKSFYPTATQQEAGHSHAEGYNTEATGMCSHAEGYNTKASGNYSHAEGNNTTASGPASHVEGNNTTASGSESHAEGIGTTASGLGSHAEGNNTTASGTYSHAGGYYTKASKDYSVALGAYNAEGYLWVASDGTYIIADYYGTGTIIVDGVAYRPYTPNGSASSEQQWQRVVFSYGIGPQTAYRYNAFMITRNTYGGGDSMALVWYKNVGNGGIAPSSGSTHNVTIYKRL